MFYCMFYFTCDRSLKRGENRKDFTIREKNLVNNGTSSVVAGVARRYMHNQTVNDGVAHSKNPRKNKLSCRVEARLQIKPGSDDVIRCRRGRG